MSESNLYAQCANSMGFILLESCYIVHVALNIGHVQTLYHVLGYI